MPTYDYKCADCGAETSVFQTISEYIRTPNRPRCRRHWDVDMERKLSVNPAMSGLANALAGDRHYDGVAATDGTPIDSRTKHREYMKRNDLAMTSDFKETWAKAALEREVVRTQDFQPDPARKRMIAEQVGQAVARSD